jgi:hypothetical protein
MRWEVALLFPAWTETFLRHVDRPTKPSLQLKTKRGEQCLQYSFLLCWNSNQGQTFGGGYGLDSYYLHAETNISVFAPLFCKAYLLSYRNYPHCYSNPGYFYGVFIFVKFLPGFKNNHARFGANQYMPSFAMTEHTKSQFQLHKITFEL